MSASPRSERPEPFSPTRWRMRLGRVLVLLDAWVILASIILAFQIRQILGEAGGLSPLLLEVWVTFAILPMWLAILYAFGCYRPEYQSQSGESFRRFLAGTSVSVLILGFFSFLFRLEIPRLFVLMLWFFVLLFGYGGRVAIRRKLHRRRSEGRLTTNVLLVGAGEETSTVAQAMDAAPGFGYVPIGFVDDRLEPGALVNEHEVLGPTARALELAGQHDVGLVVVSLAAAEPGTLSDIILQLEGSAVDLAIAPSLFDVATRRVTIESIDHVPLLHIDQVRLNRGNRILKRAMDLLAAAVLGVVTLPLWLGAVLAIRIESNGPVLFRQVRVGKDGRAFIMLKFRTMVPDAEERKAEVAHLNEAGHKFFKIRQDPRVTHVGRLLRKWSLDELPQLVNVLRGDMSMVGPRPPVPEEVALYESWHHRRLRVRPGITGVWQVSGRSEVPFEEAVRLDLFYIENWSPAYDIFLLAKTVLAVLGRKGAY